MNPASTSFILGYHGCDRDLAERVFAGKASLKSSHNEYDWLGDGIYFWEHNAQRAFACEVRDHPHPSGQRIKTPAVVGSVIDLGFCLNLLDSRFISMLIEAHAELVLGCYLAGLDLPTNSGGADRLRRSLDCAVLRMLHDMRKEHGQRAFESIRAVFNEGYPLYDGAGFTSKSHIQICVCDPRCIKGYFRPLDDNGKPIEFRRRR